MPRPYPLRIVTKVLERNGFFYISQSGSHSKYRKVGNPTLTTFSSLNTAYQILDPNLHGFFLYYFFEFLLAYV